MNRISRELLKIAREINALDEEGDGSGFQMQHDYESREQERLDIAKKHGKKYILHHKEQGLWRIQACKGFIARDLIVHKGDFGGLIESEKNLSHDGYCWVEYGAKVYDNAIITDDARVEGMAQVHDNAIVKNYALIRDKASVSGNAQICNFSIIDENAQVSDNAVISQQALVYGNAKISGDAKIHGRVRVDYDVAGWEIAE